MLIYQSVTRRRCLFVKMRVGAGRASEVCLLVLAEQPITRRAACSAAVDGQHRKALWSELTRWQEGQEIGRRDAVMRRLSSAAQHLRHRSADALQDLSTVNLFHLFALNEQTAERLLRRQ
jgi:hypothetical protein